MENSRPTDEEPTALEAGTDPTVAGDEPLPPTQALPSPVPQDQGTRPGADPDRTTAAELDDGTTAGGHLEQKILRMRAATERARVKHDPLIGRDIQGRFKILAKIGEGGMGAVYSGTQVSMSRPVAIKTLLRQLVKDEKFVRRFQNEALAVSKLTHPNTIRIIDFGQLDEGTFYIVMELLEGQPFQRVMREEKVLGVRRVLRIAEQVARSLHEAHGKGIVHRDLKPDNIFLCRVDDEQDFVKVLDFGVAKMVDETGGTGNLTQTAMILGTPKYMSPEQGMSHGVDGRSDLYALGVMAYEALTGVAPFSGEPMALLYHHVHTQPKPPSEARPDIEIPAEVEALVMRLLSKDPASRPSTGDELGGELHRLREALPAKFDAVVYRDERAQREIVERKQAAAAAAITHAHGATTVAGARTSVDREATGTSTAVAEAVRRTGRGWLVALAVVLVVLGGAALGVKLMVKPLPGPYHLRLAEGALAINELGSLSLDSVKVKLQSQPQGAAIFAGDRKLGTAPLTIERLRGQPETTYGFKFDGDREVTLDVAFGDDGEYMAVLPVVEPEVPKPVVEAVKEPETVPTNDEKSPTNEQATAEPPKIGKKPPKNGKKPENTAIAKPDETPKKEPSGQVNILK